jgi:eukaryotic-like serine/threonine-protein kinase
VGIASETDLIAVPGHEPVQRLAQSYLGPLWVAVGMESGPPGELRLLRRLQLPGQTPDVARSALITSGRDARQLRHDNVLGVLQVIEHGQDLTLVYEHVEAEPLRSLQSWANLRCLSFPVSVSLKLVCDLLQGAAAMHEAYAGQLTPAVFGGLSPDSMLVARDGRTRLCDPLVSSCACLLEGIGCNTAKLAYAAPEQVRAGTTLSARTDVFTGAGILWELLATRRLLAGSRPTIERKLREHDLPSLGAHLRGDQHVSSALVELVNQALAADPQQRPNSAREMAEQLASCGHDIATEQDVAAFVAQLSGQRFDRRSAAMRSKLLPQLEAGLTWPIELPTTAGAARRGARSAALPPSQVSTPRAAPDPADWAALGSEGAQPTLPAAEAPASPRPPLPPRPAAPTSAPVHVSTGAPSAHFESEALGSPLASPMSSGFPRDCNRPSGQHPRAVLTPRRPLDGTLAGWPGVRQRSRNWLHGVTARTWIGVVLVVSAMGGAAVLRGALRTRPNAVRPASAVSGVTSASVADAVPRGAASVAAVPELSPEPNSPAPLAPSPVVSAAASAPPDPALALTPTPTPDVGTLDDTKLGELFALEQVRKLTRCGEQPSNKRARPTPVDPRQSSMQLKAARRQMLRGKNERARLLLCNATRTDPSNLAAQRGLAEFALQLGDPALAKVAVGRALEVSPNDPDLLGLLGDANAMLGDISASRELWLRAAPDPVPGPESARRLASSYQRIGARALARSNFAQARDYYRRAVVLTAGSFAPSLGLSKALLRLKHTRAGLAWAERAARAFPEDSQIQVLFGDALYRDGQPEKARAAWLAALAVQPQNSGAAQRLKRGKP